MGWEVRGFSTHSFTRSHLPTHLLLLLSILCLKRCSSFPNGADIPLQSTCRDMRPIHGDADGQPEEPVPSFLIESLNKTFKPGEMITFRVSASSLDNCFRGIYAQVRPDNREKPIGGFPPNFNPDFLKPVDCNERNRSAITQRSALQLCEVNLTWRAPNQRPDVTSVRLFVTLVQNLSTFWVQLKSLPVTLFREASTTSTVEEITFRNTSLQALMTSTTVLPSSSMQTDSDRTFSTEVGLHNEMYSDYAEVLDMEEDSSKSKSGSGSSGGRSSGGSSGSTKESTRESTRKSTSESTRESTKSTERSDKTEPNLLTTQKVKRTSSPTSQMPIKHTSPQHQRSSESMRTLKTTGSTYSTTGRFTHESTSTFLHTLMTLKTKPNDATPTLQTEFRPHTYKVPSTISSTESQTSSVTSKEPSESTDDAQTATPNGSTSSSTLSLPLSSTEGVRSTTLKQIPMTNKKTTPTAGLTTLTNRNYSKSSTPMQSSTPSSHETEFVTTENLVISTSSPARTNTKIILTEETYFPGTTQTDFLTTIEIPKTPYGTASTTVREEFRSTSKEKKPTTHQADTKTSFSTETTSTKHSLYTRIKHTSALNSSNLPSTIKSTTHTFSSTIDHTHEHFPSTNPSTTQTNRATTSGETVSGSTKGRPTTEAYSSTSSKYTSEPKTDRTTLVDRTYTTTTQIVPSTNPSTPQTIRATTAAETVSSSSQLTTEAYSSTSSRRTSELLTDRTTLVDRTSTTTSTKKPVSNTHPSTTQTIPTKPMTSNSLPSTMESTTHTFSSTIDQTTQTVSSTNPSTTQTIRATTAEKTVSGSTEVTSEAYSSTSSRRTSKPMTDRTTLVNRTSTTTSTEKPVSTTHPFTTETIPTNPLTSNSLSSTMESTTHTFSPTIGQTTEIVSSTNPSTTQTIRATTAGKTVSGSTEGTSEVYSSTASRRTSKPMTNRTTSADRTSTTSPTEKPVSSTHPFTTQTVPTSPLTSSGLSSTMKSTTHTFPSTIGQTTQIVSSTNPSTTQTIRATTAGKTVSGSTEITTEAYSSTSSRRTSEPITNRTTLLGSTSATSSTQTPTASKPSTRSTTETDSPIVEEYTTDEMETTSEEFTPMVNQTDETDAPTMTSTPMTSSTVVSTTTSFQTSSSSVRTTEIQTRKTGNITTVNVEMSSTNRQTTATSSKPSTRSVTTKATEGRAVSTMQALEATPTLGGTEIVMVFEIDNFPFNNSLEDTNSEYYKVLNDALATAVENVYSTTANKPNSVGARRFERGSVIAEMSTIYGRALSDNEMTDAVLVMFDHVTNDMFDESFNVSGFWVLDVNGNRVDVDHCYGTKCPLGLKCNVSDNQCVQYCEENPGFCIHGTCVEDPQSANISCKCDIDYSGERCNVSKVTKEPSMDSAEVLAVVLGGVGAVLLILIVILMVGMVCLLRAKPKPVLPTSMDNLGIPRFPMIPLSVLNNMNINESDADLANSTKTSSDHPSIDDHGGVTFSRLPDIITSASSIQDYEQDVVCNPNPQRRRRVVSFNDIREVLEADDTVSIETFSFGRSYMSQEEDNGQTTFRWRLESVSSSTPSRDEAPT